MTDIAHVFYMEQHGKQFQVIHEIYDGKQRKKNIIATFKTEKQAKKYLKTVQDILA